ncbi:hypothetical protein [Oryza sativa Japonica Group]|uniref:Uncharacterized protein n=1 Tax=Oryza sativa subsp. japonica TaxID=39947 RepID=Q657N9_ORYSJ|nr:hypothetical protein [Oryza sativa Japonica Group]
MSSLLTPSTAAIIASRSPSTATSAGLPNLDAYESFTVIDGLKPKNVRAFVDLVFARQLLNEVNGNGMQTRDDEWVLVKPLLTSLIIMSPPWRGGDEGK